MSRFTPSGDILLPNNYLNASIRWDKWDSAEFKDVIGVRDDLDGFLMEACALAQKQSDLLHDARRRSAKRSDIDAYWEELNSWYTVEAPAALISLLKRVDDYFYLPGRGKEFCSLKYINEIHGPGSDTAEIGKILRGQQRGLMRYCRNFAQSTRIATLLNPTNVHVKKLPIDEAMVPASALPVQRALFE